MLRARRFIITRRYRAVLKPPAAVDASNRPTHFIRDIIARDVAAGTHGGRVTLRFPPEPNGYPHLGHAKAICLNFGLAEEFGGTCNLRYDDTNPETESPEYVAALEDAVRWLGFSPTEVLFTSDYFEQLYEWAVGLVKKGLAYIDSQSEEEIRAQRGTVTEPGTPSPYRDRPVEESLRLLEEMRRGEHPDGRHVLRARIDMAHPNMKLRDPLMYRIRRDSHHYRRGDDWKIYPFYDWAHGQSDAIEGITHSLCTLEFDVNRALYDWYLDAIGIEPPRNQQIEFARLNLDYTVMSKRKLLRLVEEGRVSGWDDPRMPTIAGQRRRGVRPQAIRSFCDAIGVSKVDGRVDIAQYEFAIRDDLNHVAPRVMAVARPLKLTITNLPVGETTWVDAPYWPHDVSPPEGAPLTRRLPISREVWIERDDFAEEPPKGWRRLSPGAEVRLRHGYVVRCTGVEKDAQGEVTTLTAEADLSTLDADPVGRKVRGVIHWVSAAHAAPATLRLYDRLYEHPSPDGLDDFREGLNRDSLTEAQGFVEPSVAGDPDNTRYQFERLGYFWRDPEDSSPNGLVFNRIVMLKDSWAKKAPAAADSAKRKASAAAAEGGAQRDPTAGLTDEQRAVHDRLAERGVGPEEAPVIASDPGLLSLFDAITDEGAAPREAGVMLVQDLRPALDGSRSQHVQPAELVSVLRMLNGGRITRAAAREVVAAIAEQGGSAEAIVADRGLEAVRSDEALAPVVEAVIADHPEETERYRAGERRVIGFLMGQAMRHAPKGTDAARVRELLEERLSG